MTNYQPINNVEVNDDIYLWQLKKEGGQKTLAVHQQHQGQFLIGQFDYWSDDELSHLEVDEQLIKEVVKGAMAQGWEPDKKGFRVHQYKIPAHY